MAHSVTRRAAARTAILSICIGLAACHPPPTPATPQDFCAAHTQDDPAVHDLMIRSLGSAVAYDNALDQLKAAREAALRRCLARQGVLPPPGGVQSFRRPAVPF